MNKTSLFKQVTLYRFRYILGALAVLALLASLLLIAPDVAPRGISSLVASSVTVSASLFNTNLDSLPLIDLPYHALQALTIDLFGLSWLGITLPSMVLAAITGILFILMIRRWFRLDIAIVTGILLLSSAPFLTLGRSGFPIIMLLFWLSLILLAATRILHGSRFSTLWQLTIVIAAALSLYTPLAIYPLVALAIGGLLHPHVRYLVRRQPMTKLIAAPVVFFALILPLIIKSIIDPSLVLTLLGATQSLSDIAYGDNLLAAAQTLFSVHGSTIGDIPRPFFTAPLIVLAVVGFAKSVIDNYSARSYLLFAWLVLLLLPLSLDPINIYSLVLPIMLLAAIGVETLIREWYKLFPLNPYARIAGLLPLTALLSIMSLSSMYHYFYGHAYAEMTSDYDYALSITREEIETNSDNDIVLITSDERRDFYHVLTRQYDNLIVTTKTSTVDTLDAQTVVLAHAPITLEERIPAKITTSSNKTDAVELRTYR